MARFTQSLAGIFVGTVIILSGCSGGGNSGNPAKNPPDTTPVENIKNSGSYSDSPTQVKLVSVISADAGEVTVDWLPASDEQTAHSDMIYIIHASETAGFIPDASSAATTVTGEITAKVTGLKAGTKYYFSVVAKDETGNESWSNQLEVMTVSSTLKRTNATVLVQDTGAVQAVADSSVTLKETADRPAVNNIIVSTKDGGYLRRVTNVEADGGQITVQTEPVSINEVFEEFEFSTSVKLDDYSERGSSSQSRSAIRAASNTDGTHALHWPSGLTLISDPPPAVTSASSQTGAAISDDIQSRYWGGESEATAKAFVKGPAYSYIEPGDKLEFTLKASIVPGKTESQICKIELLEFTHKDSEKDRLPKSTAGRFTWLHPMGAKISADYLFSWTPTEAHVHEGAIPYIAKFRVFIDKTSDDCSGGETFRVWQKKLDISVPIYVGMGRAPELGVEKKSFEFNDAFTINSELTVDFKPEIDIHAKVQRASLTTATVAINSDLSIKNQLTIEADGPGKLKPMEKVLLTNRKFIRVFAAGPVPVVISGEFGVKIRVEGEVTGALSLNNAIEFGLYGTKFGLEYDKHGAGWQVIDNMGNPDYTFELKGEGSAKANITVTLIPDFQLHFYDAASSRILLEPYLYSDAAIQGYFNYESEPDQSLLDADYWFDELTAGAGVDLRLYAGLDIFDYNILSYPADVNVNEIEKFRLFQPITREEGKIFALPELTATFDTSVPGPNDSRAILIKGEAKNHPNPFSLQGNSLNPFERWTGAKVIGNPAGTSIIPHTTRPGQYWFIYTEPGEYEVQLGGHSKIGRFIRQIASTTITIGDLDNDGMADQWEERWQVDDPAADPDRDGLTNLQEFQQGKRPDFAENGTLATIDIAGTVAVTEGDTGATLALFNVSLSAPATTTVTVAWHTEDDTARHPDDYSAASGVLTFPAGTTEQHIGIAIKGDTEPESDEIFFVKLTNPVNATLGTAHTAVGLILDDDIAVSAVSVAPASLNAGSRQTVSWQSTNQHRYFFYLYDQNSNLAINTATFLASDCAAAGSDGSDGCLGQQNPSGNQSDTWVLPSAAQLPAGNYTIKVEVWNEDGDAADSFSAPFEVTVAAEPFPLSGKLNDTGITFGGNYPSGNNSDCSGETIAQQDCSHGRDVTHNDDSDGHAGFSYTKLDASGNDLPASAPAWSCVRDNVTGLIWEVKQGGNGIAGDEGLHDADDRYTWYNTDPATNGGSDGYANEDGAICSGYDANDAATYCNTQAYVARVNANGLCGASDWRLPGRTELFGLVNRNRHSPAIDTAYFPNTKSSYYWSSSPLANNSYYAWSVYFNGGDSYGNYRNANYAVRLVRGGQ